VNADQFSLDFREITTCMRNIKKKEKYGRALNNIKRKKPKQTKKGLLEAGKSQVKTNPFHVF